MTWFKVDDSFYDHPKVFDAPDCAMALWTRAGCWAARNLTDGFVPAGMPARLCDDPDTAVKELVRRKLWLRVKDGYRFHDWTRYQPTRESVHHDREAATDRKRKERERRKSEKAQVNPASVTDLSHRDTPVTSPVTHGGGHSPPTRPDPTRTSYGSKTPLAADAAAQDPLVGIPEPPSSPIQANDVVAAFVDACTAAGQDKPTTVVIKRIGKDAKRLIENERVPGHKVVAAAEFIAKEGWQSLDSGLRRLSAERNQQPRSGNRGNQHVPYRDPVDISAYKTSRI